MEDHHSDDEEEEEADFIMSKVPAAETELI